MRHIFFIATEKYLRTHRLPLLRHMIAQGHQVSFLGQVDDPQALAQQYITPLPLNFTRNAIGPMAVFHTLAQLWRHLKAPHDALHCVGLYQIVLGGFIGRLRGTPHLIATFAGMGYIFTGTARKHRLMRTGAIPLLRLLFWDQLWRHPSSIIVQNLDDQALVQRFAAVCQVHLIPGVGVDTQQFMPALEPPPGLNILFPARLLKDKGLAEFIAAATTLKAKYPHCTFQLCGPLDPHNPTAITQDQLEAWIKSGLVTYLGAVSDTEMPAVFRQAHIVALPSYREGLPKALVEAASCGLPIVATDVPGCRSCVIPEQTGFLVPAQDSIALTQALEILIQDSDLRSQFGQSARTFALKTFSQNEIFKAFDRLLAQK